MKTISKIIISAGTSSVVTVGFLSLMSCGVLIWLAGTKALPDDLGYGYYRDFNIAREAIEKSPCATSIEYSRHEDVTLEDFHFRILTQSGWMVRLWFNDRMNVKEICSNPPGIVVLSPTDWKSESRAYTTADLLALPASNGRTVISVDDVLCNIGDLAPVFMANYNNQNIPRISYDDPNFDRYLQLEVLDKNRPSEFLYTRIR
jgi:hypothetical protein